MKKLIKDLEKRLTEGQIGRREFMRGATVLGVSVAAATALAGKAQAATLRQTREETKAKLIVDERGLTVPVPAGVNASAAENASIGIKLQNRMLRYGLRRLEIGFQVYEL